MAQQNQHIIEQKKKGIYKNLLTGGISASIARTITNPIERLEILRQVGNTDYKGLSLSKSIKKFYQTQGLTGLFKGNSASIARIIPFSAIEFYSFEFYKNLLMRGEHNKNRQNSIFYTILCGGLTGLNAITLTFPLDVARTRLAVDTQNSPIKEKSLLSSLLHLYKTEGIKGLYKGYSVTFVGSIPYVAIKQTTFDFLKTNFMIDQYRGSLNFIYGGFSGVLGTVLLYPTYMIKRVLQANDKKDLRLFKYVGDIYRNQGFVGFYKGMSMTLIKIVPYQGLLFWLNEKLKVLLSY
jgi:hypothetical protein